MFTVGKNYRFTWDDGDGELYQYYIVKSQDGTVVHVEDAEGNEAIINTATRTFIRADPWH